jgi:hypothetical protein
MFLNLSNHPSINWSKKQLQQASIYGELIDMAFPVIDPAWDTKEVHQLANEYAAKIILLKPKAVHIMGEMTFTVALVSILQKSNLLCLASTTIREVSESNNVKTSLFEFIQFRPYLDE